MHDPYPLSKNSFDISSFWLLASALELSRSTARTQVVKTPDLMNRGCQEPTQVKVPHNLGRPQPRLSPRLWSNLGSNLGTTWAAY
jgi:hypothetical protein